MDFFEELKREMVLDITPWTLEREKLLFTNHKSHGKLYFLSYGFLVFLFPVLLYLWLPG
jgi:hypothetical protein